MYIISQKNAHLVNMEHIVSIDIVETDKAAAAIVAHVHPSWSISLGHYNTVSEAQEVMSYLAWRQDTSPKDTVKMPSANDIKSAREDTHRAMKAIDDEGGIEAFLEKIFGGDAK